MDKNFVTDAEQKFRLLEAFSKQCIHTLSSLKKLASPLKT